MAAFIVPLDRQTVVYEGERAAVWDCVGKTLAFEFPDLPIHVAAPSGDEWCKAEAVEHALTLTKDKVLIIHDADVLIAPCALRAAIAAVEGGEAWAVPHGPVHRYDERSTKAFLSGEHRRMPTMTRWAYHGVAGGGIVVLRRDVYEVCPIDRRFIGWGGEDQSWGWALETLYGQPWRADVQLVHLWHPHATGNLHVGRPPRIESARLRRSYSAARGDEARMVALVEGGR